MRTTGRTAAMVAAVGLALLHTSPAAADAAHSLIEGSGSGWAANAVNQWIADVGQNGLQVVFTASGSAQGRKDFANFTNDFAVSDIGFQGSDPKTGADDRSLRDYAYLPIVAGGTAFPYQIRVGGQLVKNLRLSGQTLAKIFTNQITNWNDPAITADNNGHALPSLAIIPVVHAEGSGSTAQFTRWMDTEYPNIWRPYSGITGETEYYPNQGQQIAQSGSDGVINYVTSSSANGAIAYDEYSYALAKGYPVAKIANAAGYFTLPTQYNVAVALTQAVINMDKTSPNYLLQNLDNVYTYNDPRTYPLSSYSYAIIPTASDDKTMTTTKRQTLVDYLYYSVCDGQKEMGPIGYSPLPVNLVQASFDQIRKLKDADQNVDITNRDVTTCHNPTFVSGQPDRNYLAEIAPQPEACDKAGQGPCAGPGDPGTATPSTPVGGSASPSVRAGGGTRNGSHTGGGSGNRGGAGPSSVTGAGSAEPSGAGGAVDPATGQIVGARASTIDPSTGQNLASGTGTGGTAGSPAPTTLSAAASTTSASVLGGLAAALLVAVIIAPPLVSRRLVRRASDGSP